MALTVATDSSTSLCTMKRKAHILIRTHREKLSMSEVMAAQKSGLTIYEYGDVEQYEDEVFFCNKA